METAGRAALELVGDTSRADRADDLKERASWLRGVAAHAIAVVADLHFLAGRLQGLAEGRDIIEVALEDAGHSE